MSVSNFTTQNRVQSGFFDLDSDQASALQSSNTSSFSQVTFAIPFSTGIIPLIFLSTQTFNGSQTPGLRITEVTSTGFKVRFNEIVVKNPNGGTEALSDGNHGTETVAYLAIG